ncbi:hypothetical protein SteCoe_5971 [Stentor coeruleus]|uniref:Uncharacterized protein n=1 Tax=Stentor coeruleus TaxID=5963 RepID=A0A1R2CR71_9CILI|nr:hypothetical protein SteCoe_5971 [Stentor coeruleus]
MLLCLPTDISDTANCQMVKLLRILKGLCAVQVCLGIFIMFIDIWSGIMLLLAALIFVLVIWTKSWCMCVMYILLCMMDLMTSIMLVGNYFSDNNPTEDDFAILVLLYMVKFPFYLVAIYYVFLAYREFKGLFIESMSNVGYEGYGVMQNWYDRRQPSSQPPPPQPQPFTGTGYRLG